MAVYPFSVASQVAQLAAQAEQHRLAEFARRWQSYLGNYPKPLKATKSDPSGADNILLNHARTVVDKGVAFLFGQDIGFELDPTQETSEEKYLDSVWTANRKMTTLHKLGTNGGVCGEAFVKIVIRPNLPPRLIVLDPATVYPNYSDDDIETVLDYCIQWTTLAEGRNGQLVGAVRRQLIQPNANNTAWTITDQISYGDSSRFEQMGPTVAWNYSFPPIVECQNLPNPNEYWGISDIEDDILEPVRGMQFTLSNALRIIRHHAHPRLWATGIGNQPLEMSVDSILTLPTLQGELHNLEMQSDLASTINIYGKLKEALHELSRIPEVATGKLESAGNLSGVALAILYQPLVEKTETKRRTYGDLLVELNRRLLVIGNFADDLLTTINWPELLPGNPLEERQVALIDEQLGASQDTLLRKLGYDPEQEAAKKQAEASQVGDAALQAFDSGQGA